MLTRQGRDTVATNGRRDTTSQGSSTSVRHAQTEGTSTTVGRHAYGRGTVTAPDSAVLRPGTKDALVGMDARPPFIGIEVWCLHPQPVRDGATQSREAVRRVGKGVVLSDAEKASGWVRKSLVWLSLP
jgi:hypothetical protein